MRISVVWFTTLSHELIASLEYPIIFFVALIISGVIILHSVSSFHNVHFSIIIWSVVSCSHAFFWASFPFLSNVAVNSFFVIA